MVENGPVALITGGSGGLGSAIASCLAKRGWRLGLLARDKTTLDQKVKEIQELGGMAWPLVADVLSSDETVTACAALADRTGRIDAVVHAAGVLEAIGPAETLGPDQWRRDFETGPVGFYHTYRAVFPWLSQSQQAAAIALVGPGHHAGLPHASAYAAGQAAIIRLVETLAEEQSHTAVRFFALYPGLIPTRLVNKVLDGAAGRRWLARFTESFAEGKESTEEPAVEMVSWLIDHRPAELNGRLLQALQTPEILEMRIGRIVEENLGRLRIH